MPQRDAADVIRDNPIFAGLPAKDLAILVAAARDTSYRARDYVFNEGDPSLAFCLVKHGHVRIVRHARSGKDVVLEMLGPGEAFGGVAVIERRPYPASAQTTEPTVVTKIPQDARSPRSRPIPWRRGSPPRFCASPSARACARGRA